MPYITVKAYPKDPKIKAQVADRIAAAFAELWGCAPEAISISFEEVQPEDWEETVVKPIIEPNVDKMYVLNGQKRY